MLSFLGLAIANAGPKPVNTVAREILAKYGDAVVTLAIVTEATLTITDQPSRSEEVSIEVPGAVVTSDGWVVSTSFSMQPHVPATERNGVKINVTYETKEVRIIWGDGEESPAEIVFKDEDLDLSILKPKDAKDGAAIVNFDDAAVDLKPELLDEVVVLTRQDESIDRLPRVETGRIASLIDRPRRLVVADVSEPGAPAFHESGRVLGLCTLKVVENESPVPAIRPAADVLKVLRSALASAGITANEQETGGAKTGEENDLATVGRAILAEFQDSVVSISTITERNNRTRENWSVGVVMGTDGLIAASRTGLARTDIKELKIVLGDGSELKATMVLEDLDLDLAFIQPDAQEVEEQGIEFPPSPFAGEIPPVGLQFADPVIILTRESLAFFRQPKLVVTHVDSVVENPRRYYRTPEKQAGAVGFDANGNLVGLYARRVTGEETRHRMLLPPPHVIDGAERGRKAASERPQETDPTTEGDEPEPSDSDQ